MTLTLFIGGKDDGFVRDIDDEIIATYPYWRYSFVFDGKKLSAMLAPDKTIIDAKAWMDKKRAFQYGNIENTLRHWHSLTEVAEQARLKALRHDVEIVQTWQGINPLAIRVLTFCDSDENRHVCATWDGETRQVIVRSDGSPRTPKDHGPVVDRTNIVEAYVVPNDVEAYLPPVGWYLITTF